MVKANQEIRETAKTAGIHLWQVADALQLNDGNFSRKLRRELPQSEKDKILAIIERLAAEPEQEAI